MSSDFDDFVICFKVIEVFMGKCKVFVCFFFFVVLFGSVVILMIGGLGWMLL